MNEPLWPKLVTTITTTATTTTSILLPEPL